MSEDDLSDLSSLSSLSPAPSDDESDVQLRQDKGILKFFHKVPKNKMTIKLTNRGGASKNKKAKPGAKNGGDSDEDNGDDSDAPPAKREREPSPPHEYVLADNQDIAVSDPSCFVTAIYCGLSSGARRELLRCERSRGTDAPRSITQPIHRLNAANRVMFLLKFIVMFRNRFTDAFPKNLPNFGPQELERDIVDSVPSERVENFLCALLKLLLNRQQDVKPGHYHRALEEAVQSNKSQWMATWQESPLAGGKTFTTMNPTERLTLLRALVLWAMSSSKAVRDIIDHTYKGKRKDDDANIALSVQSWGNDSDKRRYYLIEGCDDTAFRVYRESNPAGFINRTWWSVASTIDEIKVLIERLETNDGGPKARKLAKRLNDEIPRFEATEEKRRRREYRQQQRDRFKRPEPGFSLYEGRTRGKRIKYTYSDDEDFWTDSTGPRRSTRQTGTNTPVEPVTTASGRQIRAPNRLSGGVSADASVQGDSALEGDGEEERELSLGPTGRPRRSAAVNHGMNGWSKQKREGDQFEEYDSQAEEEEEEESEPDLGDDEEEHVPDEDDEDENGDDDEETFDVSKDAMLLDEEEEADAALANDNAAVTVPVKEAVITQRLSGASTPVNGADGDGYGDVTMTGSLTQSSDATATSPAQLATVPKFDSLADEPVRDGNKKSDETLGDSITASTAIPSKGPSEDADEAGKSVRLGTPSKENNVSASVAAALAYRSSPEKTHKTSEVY